jgi:class III poly(R)-hydroxyalkanoic acid synthase PhaE subunit
MSDSNWSEQAAGMTQSWMDAQRSMWEAWMGLASNSSEKAPTFSDIAEEWQKLSTQSLQAWSSAADPVARNTAEQFIAAQGVALRFLNFTARAFETVAPKMKSGEDWQKAFNDAMDEFRNRWTNMPGTAAAMSGDVESMWKLYMDQWRAFGQPWESMWMRAPGLMGRAATGDSAALFELTDVYHTAYKQTLGKLATSPNLGMTREFNSRLMEGFDSFTAVNLAQAEYQAVVTEIWEAAFKRFGEDMARLVEKGEKIENVRDLVTFWTRSAENVFLDAFRTERYTMAQGKLLNTNMKYRISQRRVTEEFMEMLDMPTRSEVDESHLRVHELRKEVKALKMQMKEMQAAVAALSAQGSAPEKRSTRKKGA